MKPNENDKHLRRKKRIKDMTVPLYIKKSTILQISERDNIAYTPDPFASDVKVEPKDYWCVYGLLGEDNMYTLIRNDTLEEAKELFQKLRNKCILNYGD